MYRIIVLFTVCQVIDGNVELPLTNLHELCAQVLSIDCSTNYVATTEERTCGSDGVTYPNFCWYAQARCHDNNLGIGHVGPCPHDGVLPAVTLTFPSNIKTTTTPDIIQQVFCANVDLQTCPPELDPYCGSDGIFYMNKCEFAKAKCLKSDLVDEPNLDFCKTFHVVSK